MQSQRFLRVVTAAVTIILLSLTLASTAWAVEYKVLYKFKGGKHGANPYAGLTIDTAGNLYGTTFYGGHKGCGDGCGTVFKLAPNPDGSWTESVLHSFDFDNDDGIAPNGSLIFDAAGNLYGTTLGGGWANGGTVFRLTPNPDGTWTERLLFSFISGEDGQGGYAPYSGLIFDEAGNLYGTTERGGAIGSDDCAFAGCGTVFQLTPKPDGNWTERVLMKFEGWSGGLYPHAGVAFDAAGNLWGTTRDGGAGSCDRDPEGCGTVWMLDRNTQEGKLWPLKGSDGAYPYAGLVFDADGSFYGTTCLGGPYDKGVVFKRTPNPAGGWTKSKLHSFKGADGSGPCAGLIFDGAGNLYGTTAGGGAYAGGTVFKLTPQPDGHWKFTRLHSFKGHVPMAGLVMDTAGNLYGTTTSGGKGYGVVFQITP